VIRGFGLISVLLWGCGRFAFDPVADARDPDAGGPDALVHELVGEPVSR
jgi:hypothetical protein